MKKVINQKNAVIYIVCAICSVLYSDPCYWVWLFSATALQVHADPAVAVWDTWVCR